MASVVSIHGDLAMPLWNFGKAEHHGVSIRQSKQLIRGDWGNNVGSMKGPGFNFSFEGMSP